MKKEEKKLKENIGTEANEKKGYIRDFISNKLVRATPEEIEAVQAFSKQLVEDYKYPQEHIQTRPQYRVKQRPSGGKDFPVDIAVFSSQNHTFDNEYILVECKQKNRKDGKRQLEDYLRFSGAELGVWFNGEERLFLRKIEKQGKVFFEEIPNIPQYEQRIEDIGKFRRKDLRPTHNLKATFRAIRNHLAANTVGTTRDEALAQQLINLIFCKIYDEKFTEPDDTVTFRAGIGEETEETRKRIIELFEKVKRKYKGVLDKNDAINLDSNSISYVVGELQNYCLIEAERDIIADAFEAFIGHALKGGQGQFFTPRNVVKMMVDILDPDHEDSIIDPACGSGGFSIEALRHVWRKLDKEGEKYHWNKNNLQEEKMEVALNGIRGIDKDYFLSKVAKAYMAIIGDGKSGIFCEDSLDNLENWSQDTKQKIDLGKFSVLLTNPPFGSKIPVRGGDKLKQFELGHQWKPNKKTGQWEKGKLKEKEAPQILFVERCLQLLKPKGRMGIVLPDGVLSNVSDGYIRDFILNNSKIIGIIDCPPETFQPNTATKTSILFLEKTEKPEKNYKIFMSIIKECGHDKRGRGGKLDELALVAKRFKERKKIKSYNRLGFSVKKSDIERAEDLVLTPKYYNPEIKLKLKKLEQSGKYELISLKKLIEEGLINIKRGNEIGSKHYGSGNIPFIRTSDISNWEIRVNPETCVDENVFSEYGKKQNLHINDILFVNDGGRMVGEVAIITAHDRKMIIQSHIRRIRIIDKERLNPYLLLYLFKLPIVKKQIESKRFIQATIPSLGGRLSEVILPIPKDENIKKEIVSRIKNMVDKRAKLKKEIFDFIKKTHE